MFLKEQRRPRWRSRDDIQMVIVCIHCSVDTHNHANRHSYVSTILNMGDGSTAIEGHEVPEGEVAPTGIPSHFLVPKLWRADVKIVRTSDPDE